MLLSLCRLLLYAWLSPAHNPHGEDTEPGRFFALLSISMHTYPAEPVPYSIPNPTPSFDRAGLSSSSSTFSIHSSSKCSSSSHLSKLLSTSCTSSTSDNKPVNPWYTSLHKHERTPSTSSLSTTHKATTVKKITIGTSSYPVSNQPVLSTGPELAISDTSCNYDATSLVRTGLNTLRRVLPVKLHTRQVQMNLRFLRLSTLRQLIPMGLYPALFLQSLPASQHMFSAVYQLHLLHRQVVNR